ncbi:hypothetical protein LRS10_16820 [Phenylobacterium sp. J426]|uniref:hypothetical protein n=1 Tax=Phenylobacterium sp. J426 TaxID=2898439 RepID=UPI002150DC11|nr:hypothetical protein [Phenylobacterium sp. J426]MCR5875681.1 hypothetical protein [Phenylobacterium sp. J426]
MRFLAFAAAALLASASTALAAPATVSVTIGPELQAKAEKTYGVRDVQRLADSLRGEVERRLTKSGAHQDAQIELVLTDAKPNRPTFKQLADTPGLSMESFGIGGAAIEGRLIAADGTVTPLSYRWYESDIRQAYGDWVWSDAEVSFDRFAARLARNDARLAQR